MKLLLDVVKVSLSTQSDNHEEIFRYDIMITEALTHYTWLEIVSTFMSRVFSVM